MTPAEGQALVIQAGQQAEFRMKEYHRHGSTLETCLKRMQAVEAMWQAMEGSGITPNEPSAMEAFESAAREEVEYWMEVYVRTVPKMIAARRGADLAFADLDRVQGDVMEKLREQAERAKGGSA